MPSNPFIARRNLEKMLLVYLRTLRPSGKTPEGFLKLELHFQYDSETGDIGFSNACDLQFYHGKFSFVFNHPCHNHSMPKYQLTEIDYGPRTPSRETVATLNATALLYRNRIPIYRESA